MLGKPLEGQLLEAKVLRRPLHPLIASPILVGLDDPLCLQKIAATPGHQPLIEGLPPAQVGVEHGVGLRELQQERILLAQRPAEEGPAESAPTPPGSPPSPLAPSTTIPWLMYPLRSA